VVGWRRTTNPLATMPKDNVFDYFERKVRELTNDNCTLRIALIHAKHDMLDVALDLRRAIYPGESSASAEILEAAAAKITKTLESVPE